MLIAAFPEMKEIGQKIAFLLKAEYTTILVEKFPDLEYHLKLKKNPAHKTVVILSSLAKDVDHKVIETILAGGIARDYGAKKVILAATYFPYMRQDKHFEKFDSFSSKHITKMFDNFDRIVTIDPHLHRIKHLEELTKKANSISSVPLIADYIKKRFGREFTIIGPDEESVQWSSKVAKLLGDEVIILKKHRSSATKIKQNKIHQQLKKHVIIIDDIISTGKTLAGALKLAKEHGANKLYCIGVHGILANNAVDLITKHAELITTNTIPNKFAKIDVSPLLAEGIKNLA